ncbi:MAG: PadR family transcriptional regulator [Actinomycetota bacterium]|nr:PadR family transcriptional regulator [Actinomycetota bacterium]
MTEAYPLEFGPWNSRRGAGQHSRKARAMWALMNAQADDNSSAQTPAAEPAQDRGGPQRGHRHGGHRRGSDRQDPWNPRGRGPWGPSRGRRRERGDVRAAILLLLAEQPRHGYEILTELADRSDGQWQPSPGSIYPVLKRLAQDGLVAPSNQDGKRVFTLTDAGRALVAAEGESWGEPWTNPSEADNDGASALWNEGRQLGGAVQQVSQLNDPAQIAATAEILVEARKKIYRLLAD